MPEWLIEQGIGETRCALVEDGEIVEARILLEGRIAAGSVVDAQLTSVGANGRNAIARDQQGTDYLLPRGAGTLTEGANLRIEVTREAIPGAEQWKRPLARMTQDSLGAGPRLPGKQLQFPSPVDQLNQAGWNDLIEEARSGAVRFDGGDLRISPTPAMTLVDVDGYLAPEALAVAGAAAAARAIRRLDIGGSIGIDLPTAGSKAARHAAAAAIDEQLSQPFERTAVNGFGFAQVVRPRHRASLVELAQDRASFEARALLRRAVFEAPGSKRLVVHPAVEKLLSGRRQWLDLFARQAGGTVELRGDPSLPMSGGYAEKL